MPYDRITQAAIDVLAAEGASTRTRVTLRSAIEAKHPGAIERARARRQKARWEARFKGSPPSWAKRFCERHARRLDELRWHRSRVGSFHGTCFDGGEISVTVPEPLLPEKEGEAKALLLHEIAHTKAVYDRHGDRFYDAYYQLLVAEGLYRATLNADGPRRAGALRAAARRAKEKRYR